MRVKIDRLGINGEGICNLNNFKDNGKVCFVDFALPNEEVEISIYQNKSKFCKAKLDNL